MIGTKECRRCKQAKSTKTFGKRTSNPDGLDSCCLECKREEGAEFHEKNPEKAKAYRAKYKEANREKIRAASKLYYHTNAAEIRARASAQQRKRRAENPGKAAAGYRVYKARNPEKVAARAAVKRAVISGKLPKCTSLACVACGKPAEGYHHNKGYDRAHWLDVSPVCRICHERLHDSGAMTE